MCDKNIEKAFISIEEYIRNNNLKKAKEIIYEIENYDFLSQKQKEDLAMINAAIFYFENDFNKSKEILNKVIKNNSYNLIAREKYNSLLKILPNNVRINYSNKSLPDVIQNIKTVDFQTLEWEIGYTKVCTGIGLEIGSGGKPIWGIEAEQLDLVDDYYKKYYVDYLSSADDLSMIENNRFDFIINSNVIEHLANPIVALREWHRVLKKGGILYLIVPDKRLWITDRQRNVSYPQEWEYAFNENRSNKTEYPNNPNTHFFAYTPEILIDCFNVNPSIKNYFEVIAFYGSSRNVIDVIQKEINEFKPENSFLSETYIKMQEIQRKNNEASVGHNFHMILRANK